MERTHGSGLSRFFSPAFGSTIIARFVPQTKKAPMQKLIYAINVSIDGCVDHTKFSPDESLMDFWTNTIRDSVLAYGRITYELMVPYWPDITRNPSEETKTDVDFARAFDSVEKLVFSKSLTKVEDKNSRLVRTAPEDEIRKLKQEPGKNILLGGVALPAYLATLGLIDEFLFVVAPVIVGGGRRLLEGINHPQKLKLLDSKTFESGSVALHYAKQ
jgi:dihydrofolate reductase